MYRNPVGHTFMMCDAVHGAVKRKIHGQDYVADLATVAQLVESAQSDTPHIVRWLTRALLFNWKEYLDDRYTITGRKTLSEDDSETLALKKARWINIGQGPDWNDPSGETIVSHPNEIWVRDGFKHTETPRIINIARWCSPKSKVRAGMQEYLREKGRQHGPQPLRSEERVAVSKEKRKDCNDSAQALPNIPVPAHKTHDEWGDQLPSGATLRDLYPYDAEDESSDGDDD